jgi:hypothetical protein
MGELLSAAVGHDKAGGLFFDRPRRREVGMFNHVLGLILALRSANLAFERRLIDLRFRAP